MALCGFPFSLRQMEDYANMIIRVQLGDNFSEDGVGKNWMSQFIDKHADKIHLFRTGKLDKKHAGAVNPTTAEAWFKLLGDYINKYNFSPSCIYGSDETGFQIGGAYARYVIGATGERTVYEIVSEDCETITVLVTICVDGSAIPPLVIFQGQTFFCK